MEVIVCWLVHSVKTSGEKYVGFKSTEMLVECIGWSDLENAIREISKETTWFYLPLVYKFDCYAKAENKRDFTCSIIPI